MKPHESEQWKPVVSFEGAYEVSNLGRIKSLRRLKNNKGAFQEVKERILVIGQSNYPSVSLWLNGTLKVKKVHRIVAEAWIKNPLNKAEVNHIDANRQNNCVENLEWVTRQENVNHAKENNLLPRGNNHVNTKVNSAEIIEFFTKHSDSTQRQIGEIFGISQARVSQILGAK